MEDARAIRDQRKNLSDEQFVTKVDAFLGTTPSGSDPQITSPRIPLSERAYIAFYLISSLIHARFSGGSGYSEKEKDVTSELAVVKPKNSYELLGVDENATQENIENAYKQKSKEMQTDVLEQKLKAQGLSESEIKIRLEQARKEYEDLQEAYNSVGNDQNRSYYDEFRKKYSQDKDRQEQGSSSQKRTTPTGNARSYEVLGVSPNPTQIEIRSAYRKLSKDIHPDAYLQQLGKRLGDLTPEELKEYNIREEKFKDADAEYRKVFNQQQLSQELREEKEKQSQQTEKQQNIVIKTTPTTPETKASKEVLKKTEKFRNTVEQAGYITITPEETAELKSLGVIPASTTSEELSANLATAVTLHSKGVKAEDFSAAIDEAAKNNVLTANQEESLQHAAFTMEAFDPKQSESLFKGNREPIVSIQQIPASATPQPNQLILQPQGDGGVLKPIFEQALDLAKGKVEKVVTRTLEKTGISAAKNTVKKFASEALKKAGKELIKQGSKIAAKAGITAAAQAIGSTIPFIGNIVAFIVTEIIPRLINFATKAFRGLLKFITGKDDLKSQLKELSGIALVLSLLAGAVVPAIISGGVFLTTLGAGSIIGGITGAFHTFVFVVSGVILSISWPVILSVFIFIFLVIFTVVIINNSAFVVPYGGFDVPQSGALQSQYIRVEKTASSTDPSKSSAPSQEYSNSDIPLTVTYTITITPLLGGLTNITFNSSCNTDKRNPPNPDCPPEENITVNGQPAPGGVFPPAAPDVILGNETYTIIYTSTYSTSFNDTLVYDTFTVTADAPGATRERAAATAAICIGDCPADCPGGWPVTPDPGEAPLPILQGPHTSGGTHDIIEAIDIFSVERYRFVGKDIRATHTGTVSIGNYGAYGNFVDVTSLCSVPGVGTIPVTSRYAHLLTRSVNTGDHVVRGQTIGAGNTSGTGTPHLHYEFRPVPGPIPMDPPYLPLAVPDGCYNYGGIPCICGGIQCAIP